MQPWIFFSVIQSQKSCVKLRIRTASSRSTSPPRLRSGSNGSRERKIIRHTQGFPRSQMLSTYTTSSGQQSHLRFGFALNDRRWSVPVTVLSSSKTFGTFKLDMKKGFLSLTVSDCRHIINGSILESSSSDINFDTVHDSFLYLT